MNAEEKEMREEHLGGTLHLHVGGSDVKRSPLGVDLIRELAASGDRIFTTGRARELCPDVGMKKSYAVEALHRLKRNKWIVPIKRGLYAISSALPGMNEVHEFEAAMHLTDPAAISHWSAMHYHGLTDQVPRDVFVLTTTDASVPRARGKREESERGFPALGMTYRFVQVKPERFFGTEQVWLGEARIAVTDPERTLIDGLTMPQYCGDFAEVVSAFEERGDEIAVDRIIDYALKLDKVTAKRLGWVLEHLGVTADKLEPLLDVRVAGYMPLDPGGPREGPCNGRWMIQENLPGRTSP